MWCGVGKKKASVAHSAPRWPGWRSVCRGYAAALRCHVGRWRVVDVVFVGESLSAVASVVYDV